MEVKDAFNHLVKAGFTAAGAAGAIGNFQHESGLRGNNLENACNKKFGLTDEEYTAKVNNNEITKEEFIADGAGYGIAQWTFKTRKKALWDATVKKGISIADEKTQLDFFVSEVYKNYPVVAEVLKTTTSVKEASDIMLTKYERPADQSDAVKNYRAGLGQKVYDSMVKKYNGNSIVDALKSVGVDSRYSNRMKIANLNGIDNYLGLGNQNLALLNKFKDGTLVLPKN